MNYRHIYHAGNFADVLKHAVVARIVAHLKKKDKAFRVIDTHAGPGFYDLSAPEAQKTGEWKDGIGSLLAADLPESANTLLSPYLDSVRSLNSGPEILRYPGSPKLVRALLRKQDRLTAIEMHPEDSKTLHALFKGDFQTRVIALDGWLALGGHVPPKERRGLVLVDPPFEKEGEFDRIVDGLARAYRRWSSGTYCLWYPLKASAPIAAFHDKLYALGIAPILCTELCVHAADETDSLAGSGLIVVNPPYTLEGELEQMVPALHACLTQSPRAEFRTFWVRPEAKSE